MGKTSVVCYLGHADWNPQAHEALLLGPTVQTTKTSETDYLGDKNGMIGVRRIIFVLPAHYLSWFLEYTVEPELQRGESRQIAAALVSRLWCFLTE